MLFTSLFALAASAAFQTTSALTIPQALHTRTLPPTWRFDGTGHYNLTLPGNRWALVHANPNYDNSKAHPLVLAFHGAGASAQNMEAITNFSNDSLRINNMDIVFVYGQGTVGTKGNIVWQGAPYSGAANDIAYVQNILSAVKSNLNIDTTRIYAAGFSNGGGFVNLLACTSSVAPTFAAFATSSAALYPNTHATSGCDSGGHPVAIIDFHGIADGQIPYAGRTDVGGDTGYALPNMDSWRQQWAQRAGCGSPSNGATTSATKVTTNYNGMNATSYRWDCPKATVVGYTVSTMGHWWLTKGGGYWDETPLNIVTFFNARTISSAT